MSNHNIEQSVLQGRASSDEQGQLVVRSVRPEDADAVVHLTAMAWKIGFRGVMSDEFLDKRNGGPEQRPSALLEARPQSIELVAVLRDEPIAWLASHPAEDEDLDTEKVVEIKACYTHPDHWRRGAA